MILELDAGNTRIKWRVREMVEGRGWLTVASGSVFAQQKMPSVFIDLGRQLEKLPMARITRLLVASVRGEGFRTAFSSIMTEKWHLQPEFVSVSDNCAGVRHAYEDSARFGVDRWLALLAAYRQTGAACCVVDCGTTITVDLLAADGRHQGGYIVPGLHLMREALAARSKALETIEGEWLLDAPGTSTLAAIHNGILAMALGFLRDIRQKYSGGELGREPGEKPGEKPGQGHSGKGSGKGVSEKEQPPVWYFTGGDAHVIASHLDWECKLIPDLVMDGLALAVAQAGTTN